jgi:molecular chaperone DnaK
VFQGEREMAADNKLLGQFDLVGIPSAPRGVPQIEVTFDIDANGIVNVGAKDKATGKEQTIRIQASGGLSDADIEQMVKDAEINADKDKARRALVEAKNHAESLIHTTEKTLKEAGDKVAAADKTAAEEAMAALKQVSEGEDLEAIQAKMQALQEISMKVGQALYEQGGPAEGGDAGGDDSGAAKADDTVVDADFEEVDDDKKGHQA